jgi:hypothetical protein
MRNWMSWAEVTLDLGEPCSFLVGRNGSGKTAVRDAVEFCYLGTGRLRGVATKKELAVVAIREGFDSCEVTVEAAGVRIRREMDADGSQEAWRSVWEQRRLVDRTDRDRPPLHAEGWSNEEPLSLKRDQGNPFGDCPDDLLRCMLEPTHFFDLEPQRRQEVLVQATSQEQVEMEVALTALAKAIPSGQAVGVERPDIGALEDAARWVAEQGFRGAEEAAGERRREAGRERDAVALPMQPDPEMQLEGFDAPVDLSARPLEEHQAKLAKLRAGHVEAVRLESAGTGAMAGKLAEAETALAALENRGAAPGAAMVALAEKKARAEATLEAAKAAVPQLPREPDAHDLVSAKAYHEGCKARLQPAATNLQAAEAAAQALEAQAAQKPESFKRPEVCPKGPAGMRCPVKPSVWKPSVAKLVADPSAHAAELDRLRGEVLERRGDHVAVSATYKQAAAALEKAQKLRGSYEDAVRARQGRIDEVAQAASDLESARAAASAGQDAAEQEQAREADAAVVRVENARQALEDAARDEKPTGPSVVDLAAQIAVGERVVDAAGDYWREAKAHQVALEKLEVLEAEWSRWDAIAQQLKPTGIETTLGGGARQAFIDTLAEAVILSGEVFLDEDAGLTVEVIESELERPLHPVQLSTSQKRALGVALQHALCVLEGFPFLLVDAIDTFDAQKRAAFTTFAAAVAQSTYPAGVIGMATITREPPGAPPEPWTTLWVQPHGEVLQLGGEGF